MKTKIQLFAAFLLLAVGALWLTSCSSEDAVQGSGSQADASLTLTINTGKVGSRATAWDGTTTPTSTDENTINRLTVGIFDASTKKVKTIVELTTSATTGGNSLSVSGNTATATIVTTSLATGDDVLVAANAPAGNFAGVADETGFNAKTEGIEIAVLSSSDYTKEINTNIPMYGASTLNGSGSTFTATVSVQHQLAKITLDNLSVDFAQDGPYKSAKFTPTEFFVVNVPTSLAFSTAAIDATATHLHGFGTAYGISAASEWGAYKEYLATGTLSGSALFGIASSGTEKYGSKSFFYVTPSTDVTSNGKMKLIIAGKFDADGTGAAEETVFYPVAINATYDAAGNATAADGGTLFQVSPNKNYKCTVVIKTKGTTDPTKNLDPQTATVNVTVTDFVEASQTTTFE
ncbi:MAG: fimbrial protein [Prevotella copri]|nr:fimbrial protein [Segatella copri]